MPGADASLLSALAGFGYAPPGEGAGDVNAVLARLSASRDQRLLGGFPVVLANAPGGVDLARAVASLRPGVPRTRFRELVAIAFYLLESHGLGALRQRADPRRLFGDYRGLGEALARGRSVALTGGGTLEPAALERVFRSSVGAAQEARTRAASDKARLAGELKQEYLLSLLLSPKQKDLLSKRLEGASMSKTEREYYSRVVRKKLAALVDPELQKLALRALS